MVTVRKLNHSGFIIKDKGLNIFIDPFEVDCREKADIILITHPHFDHYSIDDINRICKDDTKIVCPGKNFYRLDECMDIKPWEEMKFGECKVIAVPSYNKNKHFHPKSNGWVGYIVEVSGHRIYHAGDTDFIDEMKNIKNIDYAMFPISGTYTMNAKEAAAAANMICPKCAIPMHYGDIIGSIKDVETFRRLCSCKVIV